MEKLARDVVSCFRALVVGVAWLKRAHDRVARGFQAQLSVCDCGGASFKEAASERGELGPLL